MARGHLILLVLGAAASLVFALLVTAFPRPSASVVFPAEYAPTYEDLRTLDGEGQSQTVTIKRGEEQLALGIRSYPNPDRLTADQWIRANWDPSRLLVLRPIAVAAGEGVQLVSADAWIDANPGEVDFPMLVALSIGERVVLIDRLNGVPVEDAIALELIAQAKSQ